MKKLKAFELLVASKEFFYPLQKSGDINYMQIAKQQINDIDEAIEELELYTINNSCNDCKHLEEKEENLKNHCLIDVCRSCKRSNIDKWERK